MEDAGNDVSLRVTDKGGEENFDGLPAQTTARLVWMVEIFDCLKQISSADLLLQEQLISSKM